MKESTSNKIDIRKICELSLLLAFGVIFSYVESLIPLPLPIPGIKLGLANIISIVILYWYSPKEYLFIGLLRVLIVGLLRNGIVSISFVLSLSGYLLSSLVTLVLYYFKKFSIYSLSVCSAVSHVIGQMIIVLLVYETKELIFYLPFLLMASFLSGIIISIISCVFLQRMDKHFEKSAF